VSSPPIKKLRILHDRSNPFLVDRLFQYIMESFPLITIQNAALVSKRWHLFACNRLNHLLFNHDASSMSEDDLDEAVNGLEKMKDLLNQRLQNLSEIRRNRIVDRFYSWYHQHQEGPQQQDLNNNTTPTTTKKQEVLYCNLPKWMTFLRAYGFAFREEGQTCTAEDIFWWLMNNEDMDDATKEYWVKVLVNTDVEEFSSATD